VRLSPLGTSATIWTIVPAADDRQYVWSNLWNENWQTIPKYSEKTSLSATLSTTNPTRLDLGSNPDRRGGKSGTNRLSYGSTNYFSLLLKIFETWMLSYCVYLLSVRSSLLQCCFILYWHFLERLRRTMKSHCLALHHILWNVKSINAELSSFVCTVSRPH
jgi:hypothetical protein